MVKTFQNIKLIRKGRLAEIKSEIEKINLLVESDLGEILMIISTLYKSISSLPSERLMEIANRLNKTILTVRELENEASEISKELNELE
jgi:hypothetical protein